ncbi:uncharacterized protein LOC107030086 [Solanum pennellii]|uniref:Uncharacterized protein LOC107030086 n=1 Tax=Solanum pennellii TaxID=28526 RepID=A0ABM1HKX2_SOLPN|nr:uncharacterized protein LOC107030086 [Solanum pennellii]
MLHGDMNLSRLMVYSHSIDDPKLSRISRNVKRSRPSEKYHPRFKKRVEIQDEPRDLKVYLEKGSGSQGGKPTCVTCAKKHYGKCLIGSGNCFARGKDLHKMRDCPTIAARGKKSKKDPPSIPEGGASKGKARFYAHRAKGENLDDDYDVDKLYLLCLVVMSSF